MNKQLNTLLCLVVLAASCSAHAQSLFDESTYKPLAADHRALKKGDLLTVLVYENASASASADTDTNKNAGVGASASDGFNKISGNVSLNNDFTGSGTMTRAGQLVASVSVTITDVLANGDLEVIGEQLIEFNNEQQHISVEGRARPIDVSSQNTILSSRLADARIQYKGEGLLSSRAKPGIITRIFNWLF